ncbi:MAG: hypothetical protein M1608_02160, partial [Candidatus Omnitrophica bacterium]|nr:hypothetical protein [Candidatus Omnitrophota bacterium]
MLEARLKASRDGIAEFFWSNTNQGQYGGFSQEKSTRFNVTGDDEWHVYRVMPFWQREGRIIRLRFDVFDGASFEIDYIRIVQLDTPPRVERPVFNFAKGTDGWQSVGGAVVDSEKTNQRAGGISLGGSGWALSPPLDINAEEQNFVSLTLSANRSGHATLLFATESSYGLHSLSFPVDASTEGRTYNLDMLSASEWRGRVIALGLAPLDVASASLRLDSLEVTNAPQGPPQLKVLSFALDDALPRDNVPTTLSALISNSGGEILSNLQANLALPDDVEVLHTPADESRVARLGFGEEAVFNWRVLSAKPLRGQAT